MRAFRVLVALAALAVLSTPAYADGFITPVLGYNFGGDSTGCVSLTDCQNKNLNLGVAFGSMGQSGGFEEDISYARDFFAGATDSGVFTMMSNLMLVIPLGPVQPYGVGGVGLIRPHASGNPLQVATSKNAFGYDLGFGLTLMFGHHIGLRGDLRRFRTLEDVTLFVFSGEPLTFWRGSLGVTFR